MLATNMLVAMGFWEKTQAANDTLFLPSRHRTLPILATVTPIANYPTKLRIFRTLGQFGLNHPADQKVFLLGHGPDRGPFGQQQFFGVQGVHA